MPAKQAVRTAKKKDPVKPKADNGVKRNAISPPDALEGSSAVKKRLLANSCHLCSKTQKDTKLQVFEFDPKSDPENKNVLIKIWFCEGCVSFLQANMPNESIPEIYKFLQIKGNSEKVLAGIAVLETMKSGSSGSDAITPSAAIMGFNRHAKCKMAVQEEFPLLSETQVKATYNKGSGSLRLRKVDIPDNMGKAQTLFPMKDNSQQNSLSQRSCAISLRQRK